MNVKSSVIMIGNSNACFYTLKKILESDCIILGVIICDQHGLNSRLSKEFNIIKKHGFLTRLSQMLTSILYFLISRNSDRLYSKNFYDNFFFEKILSDLKLRSIKFLYTSHYESEESITFLKSIKPDFIISHTPFWLSKKIREIPSDKIIIGSHPGFIPNYRGAHSSFWCIYDNHPEMNGYSILLLDSGVDSGHVLGQKKMLYDRKISFRSNDLKLMRAASSMHAQIVSNYSKYGILDSFKQENLRSNQIRRAPGIFSYCKFLLKTWNSK